MRIGTVLVVFLAIGTPFALAFFGIMDIVSGRKKRGALLTALGIAVLAAEVCAVIYWSKALAAMT